MEVAVAELAHVLGTLNAVLFTLGNDRVSLSELLGFITGAACVWLTVAGRIGNFPVGIANSAFFLVLFLSARLYADSGLQVVYILLGFAGWWQWLGPGHRAFLGCADDSVVAGGSVLAQRQAP
jgi:nicotinamide mononucleotide transporter